MTSPRVPLVAVAHGSRDPRGAATVEELLDEVRRRSRRTDLRVVTSYLDHAPPTPVQALGGLVGAGYQAAAVLPLLLTAAYHSKTDIPGVLREARTRHPWLRLRYGATLGPHPLLITALERRLSEAGVPIGDPGTAVVLVSAGSSDPAANQVIGRMARTWRGRSPGTPVTTAPPRRCWWDVVPAYASAAEPTPGQAVAALRDAGAPRVVVASYFLAPGYFADKVREEALAAGAHAVAPVLGAAPEVADVVLQRYTEALAGQPAAAAS